MLLSTLALSLSLTQAGETPDFSWLEGHWVREHDGRVSEEIWGDMRGGLMLATNRALRDGQARGFEFIRIQSFTQTHYCAQPGGSETVCFELAERGEQSATFENAQHDFPQRISYAREADTLTATLSDIEGNNPISWSWQLQE